MNIKGATSVLNGNRYRFSSGGGGTAASNSATLTVAPVFFPFAAGITADGSGVLHVSDSSTNTIQKINPSGQVILVAGSSGSSGSTDGAGAGALFNQPGGIVAEVDGALTVADTANATIRRISPAGVVVTVAGLPGVAGQKDGTGDDAWFNKPQALVVGPAGDVYVADTGNAAIRKITSGAVVTTMALSQGPASGGGGSTGGGTTGGTSSGGGSSPGGGGGGGAIGGWPAVLLVLWCLRRWRSQSG